MFFLYFFLLFRHKVRALKDVPTEDYRCGFNYNGNLFDVSEIAKLGKVFIFNDTHSDYTYYVRLCDDLTDEQYPPTARKQFGVNGVRVNLQTNFTEPIAFHDTQEYDLSETRPEEGFIIQTSAQTSDPETTFPFITVTFMFTPGEENSTEPVTYQFFEEDDHHFNVLLIFVTAYAKPQKAEIPPDPVLPPTCKQVYYSNMVYPFGISLNLADLNYGPHGFPITFDDDPDTIALYQPCGFSTCPTDFDCLDYKTASAWKCNRSMICEGFSTPKVEFNLLKEDIDEGFRLTYEKQDDNNIIVDTVCDFDLSENEFRFEASKMYNHSSMHFRIHSGIACMQALENNNPNQCKATLNDTMYSLDLDLSNYNKEDGIQFDVYNSKWGSIKHWIVAQPCGPLVCPGDNCPNSTGATIYLCQENADKSTLCYDYGLYRNPVDIEIYRSSLDNGVLWQYQGNNDRSSEIRVTCNWDLKKGELQFENRLSYEGDNKILLWAQTRDVCVGKEPVPEPTPAPTPTTVPYPPIPEPTKSPQPVGQTYPTVYVNNNTHSIIFDLQEFQWQKKMDISIYFASREGEVLSSPFNPKRCPNGYHCQGLNRADFWLCWLGNCYPMMLGNTNGINYSSQGGKMTGVYVTSNGYYDTKLTLSISCDEEVMKKNSGEIEVIGDVSFDGDNGYTIYTTWSKACPRKEIYPDFPEPVSPLTPTPTPNPAPLDIQYYDREYGFSFSDFNSQTRKKTIENMIFHITGDTYQNASLIIDPIGSIKCPDNAECAGVEYASAWKCWKDVITKEPKCASLADSRYETKQITYSQIEYSSGYNGYDLILNLNCNEDIDPKEYNISQSATEDTTKNTVYMLMSSSAFCKGRGISINKVTGGAVFLFIVFIVTFSYIVGGILYNFFTIGKIEIPHLRFWTAFYLYFCAGFYAATCRKFEPDLKSQYDSTDSFSSYQALD